MTELKVEVDPEEVGFDAKRLDWIEEHFRDYVDDGRLRGLARHRRRVTASSSMSPSTASGISRRTCRSSTTPSGASTR